MKVYLAATFAERARVRPMQDRIFQLGHEVISSWLNEINRPAFLSDKEFKRKLAFKDIVECYAADLIIQDTLQSSGGKNNELGLAFGQFHNKLIWTVGEPTNIFQELADQQFKDWEECLAFLEENYEGDRHTDAVYPSQKRGPRKWLPDESIPANVATTWNAEAHLWEEDIA